MGHVLLGYAGAMIAHRDGGPRLVAFPQHVDRAAIRHGFAGVLDQIEQAVAQARVGADHRNLRLGILKILPQRNAVFPGRHAADPRHVMDEIDQVERRHRERLALGVAEQASRERCAGRAGADDIHQAVARLRRQGRIGQHRLRVGLDAHDQVVEIMGHAAGQLADRLQLLLVDHALAVVEPVGRILETKKVPMALLLVVGGGLALIENLGEKALLRLGRILETGHRFLRRAADHLQRLGKIFGQRRRQLAPIERCLAGTVHAQLEKLGGSAVPVVNLITLGCRKMDENLGSPPCSTE